MRSALVLASVLALVSIASCDTCGTHTFACPQGGNANQPELGQCSGCCCRLGYVPVNNTNSCDCVSSGSSTSSFSCGAFGYQCPVDDDRAQVNCGGCCCNYGFEGIPGTCGCRVASATPSTSPVSATPSPSVGAIPSPAAQCGAFAYQCPVADDRAIGSCSGCCCQYGYESSGSGCGCVAASVSAAPSPSATSSTGSYVQPVCGLFSYQCSPTDDRAISGCDGCCCNYGYETDPGTCSCRVASTSSSPIPTAGSTQNQCGAFSYQCAVTDDRAISGCDGCCCNYGYTSAGGCACAPASSTPSPSINNSPAPSNQPTCGAFSYQCAANDASANPSCSGCCCNYGYSPVSGTCGCALASKSPAPTPVTPSPTATHVNTCSSNSYQCSPNDASAIPGCGGCCCNWGYAPSGGCACAAVSKSPSRTPAASPSTAASVGATCGIKSYQCAANAANANPNCPGCCCNYGTVPVGSGSCACSATPTPSPPAAQTCGANSFQCQVGSSGAISGCGTSSFGCCCFYGYNVVASTCGCAAASKTPSPSPGVVTNHAQCGTNSFNCAGVGSANQVSLTGNAACSQCCCFWGYRQVGSTCACTSGSA